MITHGWSHFIHQLYSVKVFSPVNCGLYVLGSMEKTLLRRIRQTEKPSNKSRSRKIFSLSQFIFRLRAVSLFSVVRQAKRKTRKWPRVTDGARRERLHRSRARALLSLNLKKKRDCSQSSSSFKGSLFSDPHIGAHFLPHLFVWFLYGGGLCWLEKYL